MKRKVVDLLLIGVAILVFFQSSLSVAVTFDELAIRDADTFQVIDCRESEFFNGWPEKNQTRGGHFPSAVNFSAQWLNILDDDQIHQQLTQRRLKADRPTYLYCSPSSQQRLKAKLETLQFSSIKSIEQPVTDYQGELVALENFQHLVPVSWVKQVIEDKEPVYAPNDDYKIVEVAWGPPTKYLVSHIPGALYLNTNNIESEARQWNRVKPETLRATLKELGIRHDTTVVLYGRSNMAAGRAANILMYAGVEDVRLIDGGWQAWEQAGYPTEVLMNEASPVEFGVSIPAHPEYLIDIPEAKQILADPEHSSLVSIRSWPEYTGETSGYSYIGHKGRIKGSRWGHAGSDAYHLEDFHNPDGTMVSADLITAFWHEWDIHKQQNVAFYCGTGWRASEVFFYAYVMGWRNISVFDGGWYEWSNDETNPVESGEIRGM